MPPLFFIVETMEVLHMQYDLSEVEEAIEAVRNGRLRNERQS